MKFESWLTPAVVVMAEVSCAYASAAYIPGLSRRTNGYDDLNDVYRRNPDSTSTASSATQSTAVLNVGTSSTADNTTVATACSQAMSNMTTISNGAGYAGCYNILAFNSSTSQFQADLRIFSTGQATGDFASVTENMILVLLKFPSTTVFKSLTKRSLGGVERRQSGMSQIQQYSLQGGFNAPVDLSKLNDTQKASLIVPQITLQTTNNGSTFSSNMSSSDVVYFATGQFTELAASAAQVSDPTTASQAISLSKTFVLPGRTLGIFPVGLIVTSVWTFMFILAYGMGTIARLQYRAMYRKRIAAMARLPNSPIAGMGKF